MKLRNLTADDVKFGTYSYDTQKISIKWGDYFICKHSEDVFTTKEKRDNTMNAMRQSLLDDLNYQVQSDFKRMIPLIIEEESND